MAAHDFFDELAEFTALWVKKYLPAHDGPPESPWHGGTWENGHPFGAIIHYTGDVDVARVMRWFLQAKWKARVSSHAVVLPSWTDELRELAKDLPQVATLEAPILQPVSPWEEAWHATWTNDWAYGIENIGIGELQSRGGEFFSWRPRDRSAEPWTMPWDTADGEPIPMWGRWWVIFPPAQVKANVQLLQHLQAVFGEGTLQRERVLGHECVQVTKRDPGPVFPMHAVRSAVFSGVTDELEVFAADPLFSEHEWRDSRVMAAFGCSSPQKAWDIFAEEARMHLGQGVKWSEMDLALQLLGYPMVATTTTIEIFQRMMGLDVDGIVGKNTRRALLERLEDRGLIR